MLRKVKESAPYRADIQSIQPHGRSHNKLVHLTLQPSPRNTVCNPQTGSQRSQDQQHSFSVNSDSSSSEKS